MGGYESYKFETSVVVSWVLQTAKDHGNDVQTTGSGPANPPATGSTRLKGRNRTLAKRAAKQRSAIPEAFRAAAPEGDAQPPKYEISTEEILNQTRFLSALRTTLVMPRSVWRCYKSAIAARRRYADRYAKDQLADPRDNEGHLYFNWVLEQMEILLKDRVVVQKVAKAQVGDVEEVTTEPLANLFEKLNLATTEDEDFESDGERDIMDTTSDISSTSKVYVPKLSKEEELRFEWFCFLEDAQKAWKHIQTVWTSTEDQNNPPDPGVAAFITEAAIELIGYQEQQIYARAMAIGGKAALVIGADPSDPFYLGLTTLRDIANIRKSHKGYIFPLEPLSERYYDLQDPTLVAKDQTLVQYMMELGMESMVRKGLWETEKIRSVSYEQPLPAASLDQVSVVLQAINDGGPISVQAALAAETILSLSVGTHLGSSTAFSKLLSLGQALDKRMTEAGKKVQFAQDHRKLAETFRTVRGWVCAWPFPGARRHKLQAAQKNDSLMGAMRGCVLPPDDSDFLRKANPVLCGKLRLTLFTYYEEAGLSLANTSPHVYAMSYLYNGLKQTERLSNTWGSIKAISKRHSQELFMGPDFPVEAERMVDRMRVSAGTNPHFLKVSKYGNPSGRAVPATKHARQSNKTWDMDTLPTIQILRDYLHDEETLLRTLYRFGTEMQKALPERNRKSIDELGLIHFLETLQEALEEAVARMKMDYVTINCACSVLFQKMEAKMGSSIDGKAATPEEWMAHTTRSYVIANTVLRELWDMEDSVKARKAAKLAPALFPTPLADIASEVIAEYVKAGGKGIPS